MKSNIKTTLFLVFISILFISEVFAQHEATEEEIKEFILSKIQSSNYDERESVIGTILFDRKIPEVLPILERDIWKQDRTLAYYYLLGFVMLQRKRYF